MISSKTQALEVLQIKADSPVKPDSPATKENVEKAFRSRALVTHPDKCPPDMAAIQTEKFKELIFAKQFLLKLIEEQNASTFNDLIDGSQNLEKITAQVFREINKSKHSIMVKTISKNETEFTMFGEILEKDFLNKLCNMFSSDYEPTHFEILKASEPFPPTASEHIYQFLMKNDLLVSLRVPQGFFNAQQAQKLKLHVQANKNKNAVKIPYFKIPFTSAITLGISFTVAAKLITSTSLFNCLLLGAGLSIPAAILRKYYLNWASQFYNSKDKIEKINDSSVIKALNIGLDIQSPRQYVGSFFRWDALRHPIACSGAANLQSMKPIEAILAKKAKV